jgi:hypothetical protein
MYEDKALCKAGCSNFVPNNPIRLSDRTVGTVCVFDGLIAIGPVPGAYPAVLRIVQRQLLEAG